MLAQPHPPFEVFCQPTVSADKVCKFKILLNPSFCRRYSLICQTNNAALKFDIRTYLSVNTARIISDAVLSEREEDLRIKINLLHQMLK